MRFVGASVLTRATVGSERHTFAETRAPRRSLRPPVADPGAPSIHRPNVGDVKQSCNYDIRTDTGPLSRSLLSSVYEVPPVALRHGYVWLSSSPV